MREDIHPLIHKYIAKGILVDSNLLLLLLIGNMDKEYIPHFKRTKAYTPEDYELLLHFISFFSIRVTTPNILTEVSNLAKAQKRSKQDFWKEMKIAIERSDEKYFPSLEIAQRPECAKFALTDTCIMALMENKYLLLTDDFDLAQYIQSQGGDVINFNHLRGQNW